MHALSPYELVASVLECDPATLHPDSGYHQHPGWDSFAQLSIILAIEEEYSVSIDDDDILKFASMAAIENLCGSLGAPQAQP